LRLGCVPPKWLLWVRVLTQARYPFFLRRMAASPLRRSVRISRSGRRSRRRSSWGLTSRAPRRRRCKRCQTQRWWL
jgi:hypothetical protein